MIFFKANFIFSLLLIYLSYSVLKNIKVYKAYKDSTSSAYN